MIGLGVLLKKVRVLSISISVFMNQKVFHGAIGHTDMWADAYGNLSSLFRA